MAFQTSTRDPQSGDVLFRSPDPRRGLFYFAPAIGACASSRVMNRVQSPRGIKNRRAPHGRAA